MTLFNLINLWSVKADVDSDVISHAVLHQNERHCFLATGFMNGKICIHSPESIKDDETEQSSVNDLLVEKDLSNDGPLLDLSFGNFTGDVNDISLAVLQSKILTIFRLIKSELANGIFCLEAEHTNQFKHDAYNFCTGYFGRNKYKEFICVQSIDGLLLIYCQGTFHFQNFLPKFLIPGPITYLPSNDMIATISTAYCVEAYRYQDLAMCTSEEGKDEGKVLQCNWSLNIGEYAIDLYSIDMENSKHQILILGEQNLFMANDEGKLLWTVQPESNYLHAIPYRSINHKQVNTIAITDNNLLHILEDKFVKWSCKLDENVSSVNIVQSKNLKNVVVTFSPNGSIHCSYLGTDPQLQTKAVKYREVDMSNHIEKLKTLQKKINAEKNNPDNSSLLLNRKDQQKKINLKVKLEPELKSIDATIFSNLPNEILSVARYATLHIECQTNEVLSKMMLSIDVKSPLKCNRSQIVSDSNSPTIEEEVKIYLNEMDILCNDLTATVVVSITTTNGGVLRRKEEVALPMRLVMVPFASNLNLEEKLTFKSNQSIPLHKLFIDYQSSSSSTDNRAIGFSYYNIPNSSVTLAYNQDLLRICSNHLAYCSLPYKELLKRLSSKSSNHDDFMKENPFELIGTFPFASMEKWLKSYLNDENELRRLEEELNKASIQFRALQLITNNKMEHAMNNNMENYEGTYGTAYNIVVECCENCEKVQKLLYSNYLHLISIFNLFISLILSDKRNRMPIEEKKQLYRQTHLGWWENVEDMNIDVLIESILYYSLHGSNNNKITNILKNKVPISNDSLEVRKKRLMNIISIIWNANAEGHIDGIKKIIESLTDRTDRPMSTTVGKHNISATSDFSNLPQTRPTTAFDESISSQVLF
ncbi:hypothetical protein SNEBB_009966 [Seison nebaliae]|nr:hypothetical protein SNEBB_009966 [Seison nebaliae]